MIIVHEELQLRPRDSPNQGGGGRKDAGGGWAGIKNRDFTERVAGFEFGEFEFGGLALATNGEFT
jgi:hypothetical protein